MNLLTIILFILFCIVGYSQTGSGKRSGANYIISGDNITVDASGNITTGGYLEAVNIRGSGTNQVDWRLQVGLKRAGVTTYSNQNIDFTTIGAANKNGGGATFYMEYEAGDKVWVTLSRIGGSGDFVIETSMFNLIMIYAQ